MLLVLLAAAAAQHYDNADALRQAAELQSIMKAHPFDPAAFAAETQRSAPVLAQMQRCNAINDQAEDLRLRTDARVRAAAARSPHDLAPAEMISDLQSEQDLSPDGLKQLALTRRWTACLRAGGTVAAAPSPVCARQEDEIGDLLLAHERAWLAYRGPMAAAVHSATEAEDWSAAWILKHNAFEKAYLKGPDGQAFDALRHEHERTCAPPSEPSVAPPKPAAAAEPAW